MIGRVWRKFIIIIFKFFNPKFRKTILYSVPRVYFKDKLKLGDKVHINDNVFINAVGGVEIGNYSTISHGVSIISTKNNTEKWISRKEDEDVHINEKICIGKNVWLCTNVVICSGVTIADNCIIAAGSVVTRSIIEPNSLYAGIPAKFIKRLER